MTLSFVRCVSFVEKKPYAKWQGTAQRSYDAAVPDAELSVYEGEEVGATLDNMHIINESAHASLPMTECTFGQMLPCLSASPSLCSV